MICPRCGAESQVTETREASMGTFRRRRQCFNGHRFTTFEVYEQTIKAAGLRDMAATWRKAKASAKMWWRDRAIIMDARSTGAVAAEHGITGARVRQIRAGAATSHPSAKPGIIQPGGSSAQPTQKGKRK